MMKTICIVLLLILFWSPGLSGDQEPVIGFTVRKIGELPSLKPGEKNPGVAGAFSGITNGRLIVAGGANFPGKKPWEGGIKEFSDKIYLFCLTGEGLKEIGHDRTLPEPLAYGASVGLPDGVLCIGGNNRDRCSSRVFLLGVDGASGEVSREAYPELPVPVSYASAVLLRDTVYLVGGSSSPDSADTGNFFFKLDLSHRKTPSFGWERLPGYPGMARIYGVAAVQSDGTEDCIFLFGGRNFQPQKGATVFTDGLAYHPASRRWNAVPPPGPDGFPVMAGAAFPAGGSSIVFVGGAPGSLFLKEQRLKRHLSDAVRIGDPGRISSAKAEYGRYFTEHPGFSKRILLYNTITHTVVVSGEFDSLCPVTTRAIPYQTGAIIAGGEVRPGIRTPDLYQVYFHGKIYTFGWLNSAVMILYFVVLVVIGFVFSRKQKSTDDYFKGGGRIPSWAAGLSLFGTALSSITFMAIPAKTYATDWSYFLFNMSIFPVAPLIICLFIPFYRKLNVTTAYEYLEKRFNLAVRLVGSVSFILFQIGRMAIVLLLPSLALNVVTGADVFLCIVLMGVISLVYTWMGGIEAVVWTDVIQVAVLLSGAVLALFLMLHAIDGGVAAVWRTAVENRKFNLLNVRLTLREPSVWVMLLGGLFTNLTTYGTDQTMVQRYLTTKTEKGAQQSVWTNAWLAVPATMLFFALGTTLYVFFRQYPGLSNPVLENIDSIFPWYIVSRMPAGLSGLLIAGIFAAAMSSLSGSMNSAATAYTTDIHFRFFPSPDLSRLKTARIATLVAGLAGTLFAVFMATWNIQSLWDEFNTLLGLIIGGLGGLFLLGMLTRRANGAGALLGVVFSVPVQVFVSRFHVAHLLLYSASGVVSCFIFGWLGSLCFPHHHKPIGGLTVYHQDEVRNSNL